MVLRYIPIFRCQRFDSRLTSYYLFPGHGEPVNLGRPELSFVGVTDDEILVNENSTDSCLESHQERIRGGACNATVGE